MKLTYFLFIIIALLSTVSSNAQPSRKTAFHLLSATYMEIAGGAAGRGNTIIYTITLKKNKSSNIYFDSLKVDGKSYLLNKLNNINPEDSIVLTATRQFPMESEVLKNPDMAENSKKISDNAILFYTLEHRNKKTKQKLVLAKLKKLPTQFVP